MLAMLLATTGALLALLGGWTLVQAASRRQARHHPEAGPYREIGCAGACGHCGLPCGTAPSSPAAAPARLHAVED